MTDADKLAVLWDERGITRTMLDFGRALDAGDWPLYRSTFTDVILVDFRRLTGSPEIRVAADDWTEFAEAILSPVRRHHVYSNFHIRLDGERASALVYMTARHWKPTDLGTAEYTQYGWYDVKLVRAGERWLIRRIKHDFQWVSGNNALFDMAEPRLAASMRKIFSDNNRAAALAELAL